MLDVFAASVSVDEDWAFCKIEWMNLLIAKRHRWMRRYIGPSIPTLRMRCNQISEANNNIIALNTNRGKLFS